MQLANSLFGVLFRCDEQIVESIISRVKKEFERRLERQTKVVSLISAEFGLIGCLVTILVETGERKHTFVIIKD